MAEAPENARFEVAVEHFVDDGEQSVGICFMLITSGCVVRMNPEDPQAIIGVDINAETGVYDSFPGNGSFYVHWNSKEIELCAGKYGSGGELTITLVSTPPLLMSLRAALKAWQNAVLPH